MREHLAMLCVLCAALIVAVEGSASLLARPPLGKRTGFIVNNESSGGSNTKSPATASTTTTTADSPSFVSVGIRSGCAREKAATITTLRNKDGAGDSAASRLRGGSTWIPHPPVKLSRAELEQPMHAKTTINNANPVSSHRPTESSSCNSKGMGGDNNNNPHGAEFTVSKQRMADDSGSSVDNTPSFEDEGGEGDVGAGGGGGGGGGGRVGSLPSFPRTLPATNSKAPFNKKFAWVP